MRASSRAVAAVILAAVSCAAVGCTQARLQKQAPPPPPKLDNLLEIKGEFCTEESRQVAFPLKVVYIIDQSASLQCTDPTNLRYQALEGSVADLQSRDNAEFAFVGFSSWSRLQEFTTNRDDISQFLDPAGGLGPATDYQGALATALRLLEQDMINTDVAELARTRYVINFISDGQPEPTCLAGCEDDMNACSNGEDDDGDGKIDGGDESCDGVGDASLRPDSLYGVCNFDGEIEEGDYVDYTGVCPEYNRPRQILKRIQDLLALKDIYSVGDIRVNTVLLFTSEEATNSLCGPANMAFGYERDTARALLQSMANVGEGTYRDVNLATDGDNFLSFELTSLKAEQTLTRMYAVNQNAVLTASGAYEADSDRDGIIDETEVGLLTDRYGDDSDGDNYSDELEQLLSKEGFDPLDPGAPAVACPNAMDNDGDGLNNCEERFLETNPLHPDTDGDGVLDRPELLAGTDPLVPDSLNDLDFDGIANRDEILGGTDPLVPDAEAYRASRVVYELIDKGIGDIENLSNGRMEERRCYDFGVQRVQLVATPLVENRGLNRVLVYTNERPQKIAGVPSDVRVACFEAFYNGDTIKSPESGIIDITQANLKLQRDTLQVAAEDLATCNFFGGNYSRNLVERLINDVLPTKIEIAGKLYEDEDLIELVRRNLDGQLFPRLPQQAFLMFEPIQNFDADTDCFRPWELDLLIDFLEIAKGICYEAEGQDPETGELVDEMASGNGMN